MLACLFIELLGPAKASSLRFQGDEINIVSSVLHIQTAKRQLERLQWKDLQDLPTIKRFLERVQENDGQFQYQNVTMASFTAGDDCVAEFYDHFKEPLSKAGLNGSLGALLDQ